MVEKGAETDSVAGSENWAGVECRNWSKKLHFIRKDLLVGSRNSIRTGFWPGVSGSMEPLSATRLMSYSSDRLSATRLTASSPTVIRPIATYRGSNRLRPIGSPVPELGSDWSVSPLFDILSHSKSSIEQLKGLFSTIYTRHPGCGSALSIAFSHRILRQISFDTRGGWL